jgi:hypothetical protein
VEGRGAGGWQTCDTTATRARVSNSFACLGTSCPCKAEAEPQRWTKNQHRRINLSTAVFINRATDKGCVESCVCPWTRCARVCVV